MLADLGMRNGASISKISSSSCWINGLDWMKGNKKDYPVKSVNDLKLKSEDFESIKAESLRPACMDNLVEIDSVEK